MVPKGLLIGNMLTLHIKYTANDVLINCYIYLSVLQVRLTTPEHSNFSKQNRTLTDWRFYLMYVLLVFNSL